MKAKLLNTGKIVEVSEEDHNSITYYENGVGHCVPKTAIEIIK